MILTSILGLKKAEITDNADLTVFINDNMDTLEAAINGKADSVHTHDYVPLTRTVNGKALSSDITLTASDVGAADASNYLALAGGTMTGDLIVNTKITSANGYITGNFQIEHNATTDSLDFNYIG